MRTQRSRRFPQSVELRAIGERGLRVLCMTRRPLEWDELQKSLGLMSHEFRLVWEWLLDNGFVLPVTGASIPLWSLAEKGRAWLARRDDLIAQPAR